MSEPGPESIPTSADPRSKRPTKRRAVTPHSEQASQISHLFRDPSKEIKLPQASKPRTSASLPAPPEIVANVQGSSAGAGSGEFHVYKASRRREYERLRLMQSEIDKEKDDEDWENKMEEARRRDEEKTDKNRKRREKRNAAKRNKGKGGGGISSRGNGAGWGEDDMDGVTGTGNGGAGDALDGNHGVDHAWGVGGQEPAVETPGIIIHDD